MGALRVVGGLQGERRIGLGERIGIAVLALLVALVGFMTLPPPVADAASGVTYLSASDFRYGTYIIDRPGTYRLTEDISFNPNSPTVLTSAVESGAIPAEIAQALGLPDPVDAYHSGLPLFTQFVPGGASPFTPGGPLDARYDPAAFGVGFFAAIAITADDVILDLGGHRIEQSAEHALLQRFFAVIELADQPFIPGQGPASFGTELEAADNVTIRNGTIGRSSHHGIHGNANSDVTISNITFDGYEVAAVALNGVNGLDITNVTARNRKDVPVLGTFSSGVFIKAFVDHLVRAGSTTTLTVDGTELTAADIQTSLAAAINNVHHDIVVDPNIVDGRAQISSSDHPVEYGLFHNSHGLVDGNSYSFLVNNLGVAVNGFPTIPDGETQIPSTDVFLRNVRVLDQRSAIREVVAINSGGSAAIDPVGAVFQIRNLHPDTGQPVTISDPEDSQARYLGNPIANAQALVAKAAAAGDFGSAHLDLSRLNIPASVLDWVEAAPGAETLADIDISYYCNGDSMFHVNKGAIAFKMDAATQVRMVNTEVNGMVNHGHDGSPMCGDYLYGYSHPLANLYGYGGSTVRAYTFAGSRNVVVANATARNIEAEYGPAIGFDVMTDSTSIRFSNASVRNVTAGSGGPMYGSSTEAPMAMGFRISPDAGKVTVVRGCAVGLDGGGGNYFVYDDSASGATVVATCPASG